MMHTSFLGTKKGEFTVTPAILSLNFLVTAALCWHGTLSVCSTWPEPSEEDGGGGSVVDGGNAKASVKRTKFQWHVADVELNLSPEPQEKLLWNHSLEEFQVPQAE